MTSNLKELFRYRELLWSWVVRDIKVRYKQSLLGIAWAILQPLSATIIFTVVFSRFVRVPTGGIPYPIFYYSALLPWTFSSSSITFGVSCLVNNMGLVTKIYFPREILPISAVVASFVDFLIAAVIYAGMMVFYQVPVGPSWVWMPVLLLIQVILTLGVVLFASALNVFYRDIRFVVPLGMQLWMYLTPIIYPLSMVPERFRGLYLLNPMAGLIDSYRRIILQAQWPDLAGVSVAAVISLGIFILAYIYFKRAEAVFADII
ncbi:MAG: ABC transporter permease [Anaerolineae bacterium]|nr:ABC transporter permease [Anaerolineae bacterium]